MAKEVTVTLKQGKATKNTIVYDEDTQEGTPPIIKSLYIPKWWVGPTPPQELEVTIRVKE